MRQTKAVCPLKRLGDRLGVKLRHDPDPSETGNNPKGFGKMKDSDNRDHQRVADFLPGFIEDLNKLAEEGWALLIEGPRDARAMRQLGFRGRILTTSSLTSKRMRAIGKPAGVVVLTDLDKEGRQLASRYTRILNHEGVKTTLAERRRLLVASKGVFRQVENLSRFSEQSLG